MKKSVLLILAAWMLHVAAWFLPAIKAHDFQAPVSGWKAFRYTSCAVWLCKGIQFDTPYHAALSTSSVVKTLFFVLYSPWVVQERNGLTLTGLLMVNRPIL